MKNRPLTPAQLEGCACVVCGANHRPMLPIGIETRRSSELFHCDRPECATTPARIAPRIPVAERVRAAA